MEFKRYLIGGLAAAISLAGELPIEKKYLHIPVARKAEMRLVHVLDGEKVLHYFRIPLPKDKSDPLYWTSIDVGSYKGRNLTLRAEPELDVAALCEQSNVVRKPANLYKERYRPQFHFTAQTGWINDPNGLVYLDGEYHMFYQHNPYGPASANKSWGHAVSRDLVQWKDFGDVLLPDKLGAIYSGSAVVDRKNTSGFQKGAIPPMVVFYTSAGDSSYEKRPFTQSIAYSHDRGRTLIKYEKNPIIEHIEDKNRDPKVFWHQPSGQWVMALYLTREKFVLMGSANLREWHKLSDVDFPDGHECPELFELPVDGNLKNTRWVMWEAGGRHMIGRFDGKKFTPETAVLPSEWGRNCYAGQTWNNVPDGRRLFIGWMASSKEAVYEDMPFNQQMSFPREFSLRATGDGIRLFAQPAREIAKLYANERRWSDVTLAAGGNPLAGIEGELFDITADLELTGAKSVKLDIRGIPIVYDAGTSSLSCLGKSVQVAAAGGRLDLRAIVDRTSIEIFSGGGRYVMSFCFKPDSDNHKLGLTAEGGGAKVRSLILRKLKPSLPEAAN